MCNLPPPPFEVTANSGYEFKQWSDGNTDNPRTVTVEGNATYQAECWEITYTISATAQNAKVTGTGEYKYGETAALTVIVDNGYNFKQWSDGNTDNPRTVTVTGDKSYSVVCEAQQSQTVYTIIATADNGVVSGGGAYVAATNVSLVVTPNRGYTFKQWSDGNTDNPRTITTTSANVTYVALFEEVTYTFTVYAEHGELEGGNMSYTAGAEVTLTAVPDEGYHFVMWEDGSGDLQRVVTVEADMYLTAYFEKGIVVDIEGVTSSDVVVRVRGNNIEVEGADRYAVYNLSGSKIADTTNLPRGIYLVVVGESTHKVLIK